MNTLYRKQFMFLILLILVAPILLFGNLAWFTYNASQSQNTQQQASARLLVSSLSPLFSNSLNDPSYLKTALTTIQQRNANVSEITVYKFTNDTFTAISSTNTQNELQVIQNASSNQTWQDDTTNVVAEGSTDRSKSWIGTTVLHDADGNKIGLLRLQLDNTSNYKTMSDNYFQSFLAVIFATILFYALIVGYFISMRWVSHHIKIHRETDKNDSLISEAASGFQLPIAVINKNYNSLLDLDYDQLFDAKGENALRGIYNHSANLAYMVRDLLELNQIMQKETTLSLVATNPVTICQHLEHTMSQMAKNRSAHIVHTPPDKTIDVMADQRWLERVLHTIISLTLQRMKSGSVTISYDLPDAEHTVVIVSSNSYNVHDLTETDYFSHLGVSYWVAQKIIQKMNGDLQSKQQLVQGVIFRVTLPNARPQTASTVAV